ncbi:MAG: cation diffusion facilitator family transporter [Planctomycetota bacterium]
MASQNGGAVLLALLGNTFLTVIKFVAFAISGSGAMLSESVHSLADAGNQFLLWLGMKKSQRPADDRFQYGYGNLRFLYALFSAIGIFVLGCGFAIYHGVDALLHPHAVEPGIETWIVLIVSLLIEGYVLYAAAKEVNSVRGEEEFWSFVRTSNDPTLIAVLFEDAIACLGVFVAAAGIALTAWTGNPAFDAISSIVIGCLLGGIAVWLGWRNAQLILGPSMPKDVTDKVLDYLNEQDSVVRVDAVRTRLLSSNEFRLKAEIDYDGRVLAARQIDWVKSSLPDSGDEAAVKQFAEDFGERLLDSLGEEVDRFERELQKYDSRLRHLDFESD